jgi:soluble lytic murein transglycosylase
LLRQVYPRPFRALVEREAARHKVDPHLLTAILREESRFDPYAMSGAAARGLAQFVLPTARELAQRLGLGALKPADLETPELAIALAAAYLAELVQRTGSPERAVAAYNAGEAQVALWQSTCASDEPEEFLSKVSFKETRAYLQRVLTSRNAYAEIYR